MASRREEPTQATPAEGEFLLGARYRHLKARLGGQKAVKAMARYLACLIYRLLTKGQAYVDRGVAHFESKRTERELLAQHRRGQHLQLIGDNVHPLGNQRPFVGVGLVRRRAQKTGRR
jgi:hypothetical protein